MTLATSARVRSGCSRPTAATSALVVALSGVWSGSAEAGARVNTGYFGGIAIVGYDPVAYFTEARAVKGSPEFSQ